MQFDTLFTTIDGDIKFSRGHKPGALFANPALIGLKRSNIGRFKIDEDISAPKWNDEIKFGNVSSNKNYKFCSRTTLIKILKKIGRDFGCELKIGLEVELSTKNVDISSLYTLLKGLFHDGEEGIAYRAEENADQLEIILKATDPLNIADKFQYLKYKLSHKFGESKIKKSLNPIMFEPLGFNGLHINISVWKGDENLWYNDENNMEQSCKEFSSGVLAFLKSINAFTNTLPESYSRLAALFPYRIRSGISSVHKSAHIFIPDNSGSKDKRIEIRFSDPSLNIYLALTSILLSGFYGSQADTLKYFKYDTNYMKMAGNLLWSQETQAHSLIDAINHLHVNSDFFSQDDIISLPLIEAYILNRLVHFEKQLIYFDRA